MTLAEESLGWTRWKTRERDQAMRIEELDRLTVRDMLALMWHVLEHWAGNVSIWEKDDSSTRTETTSEQCHSRWSKSLSLGRVIITLGYFCNLFQWLHNEKERMCWWWLWQIVSSKQSEAHVDVSECENILEWVYMCVSYSAWVTSPSREVAGRAKLKEEDNKIKKCNKNVLVVFVWCYVTR